MLLAAVVKKIGLDLSHRSSSAPLLHLISKTYEVSATNGFNSNDLEPVIILFKKSKLNNFYSFVFTGHEMVEYDDLFLFKSPPTVIVILPFLNILIKWNNLKQ